jgi:hypothetical protein
LFALAVAVRAPLVADLVAGFCLVLALEAEVGPSPCALALAAAAFASLFASFAAAFSSSAFVFSTLRATLSSGSSSTCTQDTQGSMWDSATGYKIDDGAHLLLDLVDLAALAQLLEDG